MPQNSDVLILFGHGARDPEWAGSLNRVRLQLTARYPEERVRLAFLEYLSPDINACVASAVAQGATAITILPMFIAQGGHLKREVPALVAALRSRYPACKISLAPPVGEAEPIIHALAELASTLLDAQTP